MALNIDYLQGFAFPALHTVISDRDAMLYALTIGLGRDPLDPHDLRYVYERDLKVFATLPLVIGHPGNWMIDPQTGITRSMVVHGAQRLRILAPTPIDQPLVSHNRIVDIQDKGERGAILVIERTTHAGDQLIAVGESQVFCRADGGFGGSPGPASDYQPAPQRPPDQTLDIPTEANLALLYRLNQDRNPLHADPEAAARAGFTRPILHGLATFGLAAAAMARTEPDRTLGAIEARFSRPVTPGETISLDLWREGEALAFRARVAARDVVVLDHGRASWADQETP